MIGDLLEQIQHHGHTQLSHGVGIAVGIADRDIKALKLVGYQSMAWHEDSIVQLCGRCNERKCAVPRGSVE